MAIDSQQLIRQELLYQASKFIADAHLAQKKQEISTKQREGSPTTKPPAVLGKLICVASKDINYTCVYVVSLVVAHQDIGNSNRKQVEVE